VSTFAGCTNHAAISLALTRNTHDGMRRNTHDGMRRNRYPCSDLNTTEFLRELLVLEKPDFVVFTGDNIDGGAVDAKTSIDEWVQILKDTAPNTHWAAVEGNHDQQSDQNRSTVMKVPPSLPGPRVVTHEEQRQQHRAAVTSGDRSLRAVSLSTTSPLSPTTLHRLTPCPVHPLLVACRDRRADPV